MVIKKIRASKNKIIKKENNDNEYKQKYKKDTRGTDDEQFCFVLDY